MLHNEIKALIFLDGNDELNEVPLVVVHLKTESDSSPHNQFKRLDVKMTQKL